MKRYVLILGIAGAAFHITLSKELFVTFRGQEIFALLGYAASLFFLGVGISLPVALWRRLGRRTNILAFFLLVAAFCAPLDIILARAVAPLMKNAPDSLLRALVCSGIACLPFAFTVGVVIATFESLWRAPERFREIVTNLCIGAGAGALVFVLLPKGVTPPFLISLCISIFLLTTVISLFGYRETSSVLLIVAGVSMVIAVVAACTRVSGWMDAVMRTVQHGKLNVHRWVSTPYGLIASATEGTGGGEVLLLNGTPILPTEDVPEVSHVSLLQHPRPETVFLIGGAGFGTVRHVLKHGATRIHFCQVAPALIGWLKEGEPELNALQSKALLELQAEVEDPRLSLQQLEEGYDVTIVDLPLPHNVLLNRFYTVEFFRAVRQRFGVQSLLVVALRPSGGVSRGRDERLARAVWRTFGSVFPEHLMCGNRSKLLIGGESRASFDMEPAKLEERCRQRWLDGSYAHTSSKFYHQRWVDNSRLNTDLHPFPLRDMLEEWMSALPDGLRERLSFVSRLRVHQVAMALVVLLGIVAIGTLFVTSPSNIAIPGALVSMGLVVGCLAACTMISFQAVYGMLYEWQGVFVATWCAGGALGLIVGKRGETTRVRMTIAIVSSFACLAALCLSLPACLTVVRFQTTPVEEVSHLFVGFPVFFGLAGFFMWAAMPATFMLARPRTVLSILCISTAAGIAGASIVLLPAMGVVGAVETAAIASIGAACLVIVALK